MQYFCFFYFDTLSQRRPSYYGDLFIANNHDVDSHMKAVYAKKSKSKVFFFRMYFVCHTFMSICMAFRVYFLGIICDGCFACSQDVDNRCGDSHWRAANNHGRKAAKLDETG